MHAEIRGSVTKLKAKGFIRLPDMVDDKGNPIKDKAGNFVKDTRFVSNMQLNSKALKNAKELIRRRNRMEAILARQA